MKSVKNYFLIIFLTLISGCSSYIQRIHDQIDKESGQGKYQQVDKFDFYRNQTNSPKRSLTSPASLNSDAQSNLAPSVKRKYLPEEIVKRRSTTSDLNDNQSDGSLWASNNVNAFLFSSDASKKAGDIIVINVQDRLKKDISATLNRTFPKPPDEKKEEAKKDGETANKEETANNGESESADSKVHDRISSVVIEEISKDHLLLRGRKGLIYHGAKRTVEVQALVSRRDINTDDFVNSDQILESSINVVR